MIRRIGIARGILVYGILFFALTAGVAVFAAPDARSNGKTIHVTSNGWHSSIVIARDDLPIGRVPEAADFPEATHLSFGWGDADYFPAPDPGLGLTLRAGLFPTPAVLHLVGLGAPPQAVFPSADVITLSLAPPQIDDLVAYIDDTFDRRGAARAQPTAIGLYAFSRFYPAKGRFHVFNNCNTWTARGLAAAGLPVQAGGALTADDLMGRVREAAASRIPRKN